MTQRRVLVVYGTRPEAIKCAPLVHRLSSAPQLAPVVAVTGQHRDLLDPVNRLFSITPDFDLDVMAPGQSLSALSTVVLARLHPVLREVRPDLVVVQGDTSTAFAAALGAFHAQIPVVHLEAGLRSGDPADPFPEEGNRRLIGQLAAVHLAPTDTARRHLLREGVAPETVYVTGNTVIDALLAVRDLDVSIENHHLLSVPPGPMVLVTTHRRESWGEPMRRTARALATLAGRFPGTTFVLPAHPNPVVRDALLPELGGLPNVRVTEPLSYPDLVFALDRCTAVLTDSGGLQEEAPSLGKPVLVLRETTERPEAVESGTVRLVGTEEEAIVSELSLLLTDVVRYRAMACAVNPYGDGLAARRGAEAISHFLGLGPRPASFATPPRDHDRQQRTQKES